MGTYRKRPLAVEAIQFVEENFETVQKFCPYAAGPFTDGEGGRMYFEIPTLEGTLRASDGDYIIRGAAGEFYPCKPDIFEQTYDPVEDVSLSEVADFVSKWVVEKRLTFPQISERLEIVDGLFNEKSVLTLAAQFFNTTPKRLTDLVSFYKASGHQSPPVKIGDKVWFICWDKVDKKWVVDDAPYTIEEVGTKGFFVSYDEDEPVEFDEYVLFEDIGDECFLSHELAVVAAKTKERADTDEH